MHTITLSASDTARFERDSDYRRALRDSLRLVAGDLGEIHVEIYDADTGITLDAFDLDLDT